MDTALRLPAARRDGPARIARAPKLLAFVSALLLAAFPGAGRAGEAAPAWAVYDAPPYMIADGPDRDAGVFDRIRHLLDDRLSGTPQPAVVMPFPRVLASVKDGVPLCFVGGVRTPERDGFALFSLPVAMFYPLRIVVHAPERARFEARGPLSLEAVLADPALRSSMLKDRSMGDGIDALIRRAPPSRVHADFGEAFRMLLADRLDYLVEYSAMAAYAGEKLGQRGTFVGLPFAEAPAPVFSRVMCPKTDWGREVIARVDAVLRAERPSPSYRATVEAWTDDADVATVRDVYDRAFLASE